jgi:hypothetical protein
MSGSGTNPDIIYVKFKADIIEVPVGEDGDATVAWLKEELQRHTQVGWVCG